MCHLVSEAATKRIDRQKQPPSVSQWGRLSHYWNRSSKDEQSTLRTSPYGMAVFPRLNMPDKKHSSAGVYHTRIRFRTEEAAPLIAMIDDACNLSLTLAKRSARTDRIAERMRLAAPPYVLSDDGSGDVEIKFRRKAIALSRSGRPEKQHPFIFTASGQNNQKLEIRHGDTIRVSSYMVPYFTGAAGAGITLDLRSVQVKRHAAASTRTAEDYGFADAST